MLKFGAAFDGRLPPSSCLGHSSDSDRPQKLGSPGLLHAFGFRVNYAEIVYKALSPILIFDSLAAWGNIFIARDGPEAYEEGSAPGGSG